jgi:ectoine hydroxylase-related dioxygenase (phytanoyl-CoA dioxygenase family)
MERVPDLSPRESFDQLGYAILRGAIGNEDLQAFQAEFDCALAERRPLRLRLPDQSLATLDQLETGDIGSSRMIDIECHLESARQLILHPRIAEFFHDLAITPVTCIQTLTYLYSSQQGAHSDLYLVSPPWVGPYDRGTLVASWIALEDADESNGALVIYPGSHRLQKKRLKEDFDGRYGEYVTYLQNLCAAAGIEPELFCAKRGDVLFWHGDFVHAGGRILEPGKTRFSLVSHYAWTDPKAPARRDDRVKREAPGGLYYGAP